MGARAHPKNSSLARFACTCDRGGVSKSRWAQGVEIRGVYRLESLLGVGGTGEVWRALDTRNQATVAVKLLHHPAPAGSKAYKRFEREAQTYAALRGPHVVEVLDFGSDGDWPWIVMALLEGESLEACLSREKRLDPTFAKPMLLSVLRGIAHAHDKGVVHRDLKPANIFLIGGAAHAKLLDFGIAKLVGPDNRKTALTERGALIGTTAYMSPEQARGKVDVDHRSDLWSVGIVAYQCLTGQHAFAGESLLELVIAICNDAVKAPSSIAPGLPAAFDAWFERATQREKAERFQSASEMADALRAALPLAAAQ
jgi:serine/threonine protein kinase